jgi:hypothetical protein
MTEAEFVELARRKWAELEQVKESKTLYELEERFDQVVSDMNRQMLESVLGQVPKDQRKKKPTHQVRPRPDSQ